MKSDKYQPRFYRDWAKANRLFQARIVEKESDLDIYTDKPLDNAYALNLIKSLRGQIEDYIDFDRAFFTSLVPIPPQRPVCGLIKDMIQATKACGVGPMAAVAGALAQYLGEALIGRGYKEVIIENGGDIFLKLKTKRNVAIFAGESKLSGKIALEINPKDCPMGVCTSSGTVGHSLSFGKADAVVIVARDAILADAVATATCNQVKSKEDVASALEFAKTIKGVIGAAIIFKDVLAVLGKIALSSARIDNI
jgi:uncharacterized protein